jgi:ribonuclease E
MEERRNNAAVEKRWKEKLKTDRARIQVGRISGFGLLEMSRQRLRPGMLESTTQPCAHCHGTGLIRSDDSLGLQILRALEEEGTRKRSKEVLLKAPVGIVNFLINQKREHVALIEARYGMSVRIEGDPSLVSPDFMIEKFKTATRVVPEPSAVISGHAGLMGAPVDEEEDEDIPFEEDMDEAEEAEATETPREGREPRETRGEGRGEARGEPRAEGDGTGKKKRRRRRRKKGGQGGQENGAAMQSGDAMADGEGGESSDDGNDETVVAVTEAPLAEPVAEEPAPKKRVTRSRGGKKKAEEAVVEAPVVEAPVAEAPVVEAVPDVPASEGEKPKKPARSRAKPKKAEAEPAVTEAAPVAEAFPADPGLTEAAASAALVPDPGEAEVAAIAPAPAPEPKVEDPNKPRKKGWWSVGR